MLAEAGFLFEAVAPQVDESAFSKARLSPIQYAKQLALAKAESVADRFREKIVVGTDTIVDFKGQIIGKPSGAKDAEDIIKKLFSAPHKVITGIALVRLIDNTKIVAYDSTTVYPRLMTERQITEHIRNGSWQGKAGAYAIQETGDEFVERIEGSPTNVMGMPMELFEILLCQIKDYPALF